MNKNLTIIAVLGAITILLGAFGAHSLKETLTEAGFHNFETAVRYQFYHVLVLLIVNLYSGFTTKKKQQLTWVFLVGILCFSGSIYAIELAAISASVIWFVTPLGGLLFVVGWLLMAAAFFKNKSA